MSRIKNFEFDSGQKQAYTYDVFGNLTGITTTRPPGASVAQSFTVLGLTNRLSGVQYDAAGNQTNWGAFGYSYDAFGMMTRMTGSGNDNTHIYTADDERLWTMDFTAGGGEAGTVHTFRLRDADAKVLRELRLSGTNVAGNWSFRKDYIHRDAGRLLASVASGNVVNHYTLDHLGTPRLVTNSTGGYVSDHHYYAYGQELNPNVSDPMKFTGHERDFNEGGVGNTTDELDYMHARYCSPVTGRFLSVDPVLQIEQALQTPQLWNRYAYALGNPLVFTDPSGETVYLVTYTTGNSNSDEELKRAAETRAAGIQSRPGFDASKNTVLVRGVKTKEDFKAAVAEAGALEATFGKVGEVSIFAHSGPGNGPVFHDSQGEAAQFTLAEAAQLEVNWEPGGCARFYGCRTAGFAGFFGRTQGVTGHGFEGFTLFSSRPDQRAPMRSGSPVYMIDTTSAKNDGFFAGAWAKVFGAKSRPMVRRDPN